MTNQTFESDPTTTYHWVEVPFRGLLLRVRLAVTGHNYEIVDFIPPYNTGWSWAFVDSNSTEILMNLPLDMEG